MITKTYTIDLKNGITKSIEEPHIITDDVADARVRAEFLNEGYINQVVDFTTNYVDLSINDIIEIYAPTYRVPKELNKNKFIVQNVKHIINGDSLTTKINAVRYDL